MAMIYVLSCYFVGTLLTAEWVSRLLYDGKIRERGSRNPGARNMGRVYGKTAFVLTLLGDASKGIVAISVGRLLGLSEELIIVGLLSAMTGHIAPFYRKFKGGEAVATFIGGITAFNPMLLVVFLSVCAVALLVSASATVAGWLGFIIIPLASYLLTKELTTAVLLGGAVLLLVIAAQRDK